MATFFGFSTIDQLKKFRLTDLDLIKRDLLNAFSIREGTMPGRPDVGTKIWEYVYEPLDSETIRYIKSEVQRIVSNDSRVELLELAVTGEHNTVRVYMSVQLHPEASVEEFFLNFDTDRNNVTLS